MIEDLIRKLEEVVRELNERARGDVIVLATRVISNSEYFNSLPEQTKKIIEELILAENIGGISEPWVLHAPIDDLRNLLFRLRTSLEKKTEN